MKERACIICGKPRKGVALLCGDESCIEAAKDFPAEKLSEIRLQEAIETMRQGPADGRGAYIHMTPRPDSQPIPKEKPVNAKVEQWEQEGSGKLSGHEEAMSRCKYAGNIIFGGQVQPIRFWCEDYLQAEEIQLLNVLMDTSERYQGITMKQRLTQRSSIILFNVQVMMWPFEGYKADAEGQL
jgi:hypothetical protein